MLFSSPPAQGRQGSAAPWGHRFNPADPGRDVAAGNRGVHVSPTASHATFLWEERPPPQRPDQKGPMIHAGHSLPEQRAISPAMDGPLGPPCHCLVTESPTAFPGVTTPASRQPNPVRQRRCLQSPCKKPGSGRPPSHAGLQSHWSMHPGSSRCHPLCPALMEPTKPWAGRGGMLQRLPGGLLAGDS